MKDITVHQGMIADSRVPPHAAGHEAIGAER